ncbi:bifunctional DNA-formamidopyrimidine glycosylase/DNA-(apurinic or apyrimidinic site) lyase [Patescibacteria group bacterium]|nr:bifunctional DNA-formamidopyrimidine glycosylase/DNA-(apurinic or apyrimidinic site) lyase [Patescibacteria group bacterium]
MPELPEVQTIVDDLSQKVVGQTIIDFWTDWPKAINPSSPTSFKKGVRGLKIIKIERRGKNILIYLTGNKLLLIHQKMTGHLMVGKWKKKKFREGWRVNNLVRGSLDDRVNQYIHAIFYLKNGEMIALSDMRKFARIDFGKEKDILSSPRIRMLGPDALDTKLTFNKFKTIIGRRKKSIKQTLMDPFVIAGIGNIYADDILWSSKVHPARSSNTLKDAELKRILINTRKILKKAIKLRGTSVGDYRDTAGEPGKYGKEILVYRKTGQPCPRCKTLIQRTVLGQRSAHFCPQCQKI